MDELKGKGIDGFGAAWQKLDTLNTERIIAENRLLKVVHELAQASSLSYVEMLNKVSTMLEA